ncbi:hypothetical protein BV20DRAFT_1039388 [Pilatotrama ljubarskyi]|nr:hypothetical protein BV20DRAFT_1039388 [Pilatotrama ljubarskyi]
MELLDLPDDVLLLVLSHLHGKDALNVALTSKRLADLALPRVAAVVECWKPSMLRRLHAYMLSRASASSDTPLRAAYLHKLTIEVHTFSEYDSESSETSEHTDADDQYYAADFSQACLVGDLLVHAQNLQELSLERFQPCLRKDPRIGEALGTMSRLTNLRLSTLGDGALHVLRACPSDIRRLTLSYYLEDDYPLPDEIKTVPALLDALAPFRNLRVLKLWNFTPLISYSDDFAPPQFPSITYLRLSESSPPALDMVGLCPNVSTLIYSRDIQDVPGASAPRPGPPWPPLKRLMLGEHEDAADVLGRLARVERLHISGELRLPTHDGEELARFLELLRVASPVELYLSVLVRSTPMTCWEQIVQATPRLRVLELKISIPSPSLQYDGWLDDLPDALRPLSIECLRIYLPRLGYPPSILFQFGALHNPAEDSARRAAAREMELRRAKSVRTLPQRLAGALPSLRYLAMLDEGPNTDNLSGDDDKGVEDGEDDRDGDSDGGEGRVVYEWDELRRTDYIKSNRWWRVVDDASGKSLEAISVEEGERAQEELIESPQRDTKEELAGTHSSLSF